MVDPAVPKSQQGKARRIVQYYRQERDLRMSGTRCHGSMKEEENGRGHQFY